MRRSPQAQIPASIEALESRYLLTSHAAVVPPIIVDSLADDGSGGMTLREAVDLANNQEGGDTIRFAPALSGGSIVLTQGQINLRDDVTIEGVGADELTISGNGAGRVFVVNSGTTATIMDVTIADAHLAGAGAGIYNLGTLTLADSTLDNNTTDRYGGAIYNAGTLHVDRGTFSNNRHAIYNVKDSEATIVDSTFVGNSGFYLTGGGAIFNALAPMTIINSTFVGNAAVRGGAIGNTGALEVTNSTLAANHANASAGGGAIYSYAGSVLLNNTLVAGNTSGSGRAPHELLGNVGGGHNLIGHADSAGGLVLGVNGNIVGQGGSGAVDVTTVLDDVNGDGRIDADDLRDNRGPTQTLALALFSPAVDAADDLLAPVRDQRGYQRRDGDGDTVVAADIGAYELASVFVVNTTIGSSDENPGNDWAVDADGLTSLRAAIEEANAHVDRNAILFAPELAGSTIVLDGTFLEINEDLTIVGPGADQLTLDGNGGTRHFKINTDTRVSLSGLTLTGGTAESRNGGGSIYNSGTLSISDVNFVNNSALEPNRVRGGAIYSDGTATLTLTGTTFEGNRAYFGGAVWNQGVANITESLFFDNDTVVQGGAHGGAIYSSGAFTPGLLTITNSRFENNASQQRGGAIWSSHGGELIVERSTFADNEASGGGAIYTLHDVAVTIHQSTFTDNTAHTGGAVHIGGGTLLLTNSEFTGNTATRTDIYGGGGALELGGAQSTIIDSSFIANEAHGGRGGAIENNVTMSLTVIGSTFAGNVAARDGGAIFNRQSAAHIVNSTFVGNSARGTGGAIYTAQGPLSMLHATVVGNRANRDGVAPLNGRPGGGLFVDTGDVTLANTIIAGNFVGSADQANDIAYSSFQFNQDNVHLSARHSLIGDAATAAGIEDRSVDPSGGNIVGVNGAGTIPIHTVLYDANSDSAIDADDLRDYGGPTLTIAPAGAGPAIDAGDDALAADPLGPLTTDQRGEPRRRDGDGTPPASVDMGAFELTNPQDRVFVRNGVAYVYGTFDADVFELNVGDVTSRLKYNGRVWWFDRADVSRFRIYGDGDADEITVRGTADDESLSLELGRFSFLASGLDVRGYDLETVRVSGGGGSDTAVLNDTPGDDVLVARPTTTRLSGDGYLSRVNDFSQVITVARNGGFDWAYFYDSPADDRMYLKPTYSEMIGDGFRNRGVGFERAIVTAEAGGDDDRAWFYDSPGNDTFSARPDLAFMIDEARAFYTQVRGFDRTFAYSTSGGVDEAHLHDSTGDDRLLMKPGYSRMSGDGFYNHVQGFSRVVAYAVNGGDDRADFYDSAGDDRFVGRPDVSFLTGPGFYNYAKSFERVFAHATEGGADLAELFDSEGDDLYRSRLNYARLEGAGFYLDTRAFETVIARSRSGNDEALLEDFQTGEQISGSGSQFRGIRSGRDERLSGFSRIRAAAQTGETPSSSIDPAEIDYVFQQIGDWEQN